MLQNAWGFHSYMQGLLEDKMAVLTFNECNISLLTLPHIWVYSSIREFDIRMKDINTKHFEFQNFILF